MANNSWFHFPGSVMSATLTQTRTFTISHARYVASKIAPDLDLLRASLCCTDRGAESQPLFGKRSSAVAGQGCVTPRPPMAAIPAMQSHMAGPHLLP